MTPGCYRTIMWRLGFLFALLFTGPLQAADLKITIQGLRSDAGQLRLAIFDKVKELTFKNCLIQSEKEGIKNCHLFSIGEKIVYGKYPTLITKIEDKIKKKLGIQENLTTYLLSI